MRTLWVRCYARTWGVQYTECCEVFQPFCTMEEQMNVPTKVIWLKMQTEITHCLPFYTLLLHSSTFQRKCGSTFPHLRLAKHVWQLCVLILYFRHQSLLSIPSSWSTNYARKKKLPFNSEEVSCSAFFYPRTCKYFTRLYPSFGRTDSYKKCKQFVIAGYWSE